MGLPLTLAMVVGTMIGSGVFLLPSSLSRFGTISIIAWGLSTVGALLIAMTFGRLATLVRRQGGPYAYTRAGYGDFAGFWIGWGYWISLWVGNAALAVAAAGYGSVFLPGLATQPSLAFVAALAPVWVLTLVNCFGVNVAAKAQFILTLLKLAPLLLMGTAGFLWFDASNLAVVDTASSPLQLIITAAALTLWGFVGVEAATVPSEHVRDPQRTIGRATVIGTFVVGLVYLLSTTAVLGALPAEQLSKSSAPFADAAQLMWGDWAYYVFAAAAVVSCIGALNSCVLLQGQVPLAAALDGLFPRVFRRTNIRGAPLYGLVISSALISVMLQLKYLGGGSLASVFEFTILLATLSSLVPYAFCAGALLLLARTDALQSQGRFSDQLLGTLSLLFSLAAVVGAGQEASFYGLLLMLAGLPVYAFVRRSRSPGEGQA